MHFSPGASLRISRVHPTLIFTRSSPICAVHLPTTTAASLPDIVRHRQLSSFSTTSGPRPRTRAHGGSLASSNSQNSRRRSLSSTRARHQKPQPKGGPRGGPPPFSAPYDPKSPPSSVLKPRTEPISLASTLNPPASTRPPPLELPTKGPDTSQFSHLFALGKAYTRFYKEGLKAIFTNRRLVRSMTIVGPPPDPTASPGMTMTRAEILLRARSRHDLSRLPMFAVILLLCGELTPFIVLAFPHLTPLTCRIPGQVEALRRAAADRRAASFRALAHRRQASLPPAAPGQEGKSGGTEETAAAAAGHVARSLGLTSVWWDRVGVEGGGPFARGAADRAVAALARDDAMIRAGGGVAAIEDPEVVLACDDRGVDVRGKDVAMLRRRLEEWVAESGRAPAGDEEAQRARVRALLLRPEMSV